MGNLVRYDIKGSAAVLTIDRPKERNALSQDTIQELLAAIRRAEDDRAIRVVVLTGSGDRVFCAGGDLSSLTSQSGFLGGPAGQRSYGSLLRALQGCKKPTVARVNGHALAGGLGLVLACDLAVAGEQVELGTPEVDRGLFPMMVMALLMRHVGRKRALALVLTGERLAARDALSAGLLSKVVPTAELDAAVDQVVAALSTKSIAVLALGKQAFLEAEDMALEPALELLAAKLAINVGLDDAREGVQAFLEKRAPSWKDS